MAKELQTKARRETPKPASSNNLAPAVKAAAQGSGATLDRKTQNEMSARFGHDFSQVRVHTDSQAAQSASSIGASAFALGNDIVFGEGEYRPGSADGARLLAHELTHVVQQDRFGTGEWDRTSRSSDASEREAETLALQVIQGLSVQAQAAPDAAIARFGLDDFDPQRAFPDPLGDGSNFPKSFSIGSKQADSGELGGYGYEDMKRYGPYDAPGIEFGAGYGAHGAGKTDIPGIPGGTASAGGDAGWGIKGNMGAWNSDAFGSQPDDVRYGARVSSLGVPGMPGFQGQASMDLGNGRSMSIDGQAGTGGLEASVGSDGATLGGGFTAVGGSVSVNDGHEGTRFGLSEGPSLAARAHWGEDKDGFRQYGAGGDVGPFSVDFTTNDPLRSLARHGLDPTGGLLADWLLPEGNTTESAANMAGLTTKHADLGTTWDVATSTAGSIYDGAAGVAGSVWDGATSTAGSLYDGARDLASGLPSLKDMGIGQPLMPDLGGLLD